MTNRERQQLINIANKRAERKESKLLYRFSKDNINIDTTEDYFERQ